ncbi:MAG: MnmC family methyltransferase [Verrucomicrobiota bacterium]
MSDGYQLVQLRNGTWSVRCLEVAETFHPVVGPEEEAESLYVRQLHLVERFEMHQEASPDLPFVIWDVGLGAGANVLVALRSLLGIRGKLRVLSFDHTLAPIRFALSHASRLGYFGTLQPLVESLASSGSAQYSSGTFEAHWDVLAGDFPSLIRSPEAQTWPKPHCILFDAYSPARNPAMWTLPLFARLRELAADEIPCAMATYSRATLLRVTLLRAGWHVGVGRATGEKDETTLAANRPELIDSPLTRLWLERALRSNSAEPMLEPNYRQEPLSESSRRALAEHFQFR